MQDFQKQKVWEKAHRLTLSAYQTTAQFPKSELCDLARQLRRSAASIPANIAEGCGRRGRTEFAQFLQIALGSASELQYHLILARDLQLLGGPNQDRLSKETVEIKRMLTALIQKLRASD